MQTPAFLAGANLGIMTYHQGQVGPIAIVISTRPVTGQDAYWVRRLLNASNVLLPEGGYIHHTIATSALQRQPGEIETIEQVLGTRLSDEVILSCARNSLIAHRKLAHLTLKLARYLDGMIDLTDQFEELAAAYQVLGRANDGRDYAYQIITPASLELWMRHPHFRMAL